MQKALVAKGQWGSEGEARVQAEGGSACRETNGVTAEGRHKQARPETGPRSLDTCSLAVCRHTGVSRHTEHVYATSWMTIPALLIIPLCRIV